MTLSSLRVATTQMVTYGHSSSSRSPVMDVFLGGVEPEVLGPLTSDIYALGVNCMPSLDALYGLLRAALHPLPPADQQVQGLVGGWAPNSPLRLPMVGVCDGVALIGNATHPDAQLGSFCALLDKSYWALKEIYDDTMGFMRPRYGNWVIFEHCMPFNVTRAYDEAKGLDHPRIWTAERDVAMWKALEHGTEMKSAELDG